MAIVRRQGVRPRICAQCYIIMAEARAERQWQIFVEMSSFFLSYNQKKASHFINKAIDEYLQLRVGQKI